MPHCAFYLENLLLQIVKSQGFIKLYTFEGEKTTLLHFTIDKNRTNATPFIIKGKAVIPKGETKILGVIMDSIQPPTDLKQ